MEHTLPIQEQYYHYSFYVDELDIDEPISFELWQKEYLPNLIKILGDK